MSNRKCSATPESKSETTAAVPVTPMRTTAVPGVTLPLAPDTAEERLVAAHTVMVPVSGRLATQVLSPSTMRALGHSRLASIT